MDWIAALILAIGIYYTGQYKWWGWLFSIFATLIWIWIGYEKEIYGMVALNVFLTFLNIKNCIRWFRNKKKEIKLIKKGNIWTIKNSNKKF